MREWVDFHSPRKHWAQVLREAGYATGYFGKWHVEQSNELGQFGWDEYDAKQTGARGQCIEGTALTLPKEGYRRLPTSPASWTMTPPA